MPSPFLPQEPFRNRWRETTQTIHIHKTKHNSLSLIFVWLLKSFSRDRSRMPNSAFFSCVIVCDFFGFGYGSPVRSIEQLFLFVRATALIKKYFDDHKIHFGSFLVRPTKLGDYSIVVGCTKEATILNPCPVLLIYLFHPVPKAPHIFWEFSTIGK